MSGLEAVELNLSELERTHRIDSEFYKKENLTVLSILDKTDHAPLTSYFTVSDGNHMSISHDFREEGIRYYRGADIYNFFIEEASPICISEKSYYLPVMKRSHLAKGDILMSIVGAIIGNIALVRTNDRQTCSCKLAIMRPKKGSSSLMMAVYLKTKYAQNQIQKFRRGAAQTGFLLEDADQVIMPVFSSDFCERIEKVVENMNAVTEQSTSVYVAAEKLLLQALGLNDFTPSIDPVAVKSFAESFGASGRLDAEYYQPKHEEVLTATRKNKTSILSDLVTVKKSIEPGSAEYTDEGIPFLRVSDITKFGITNPEIHLNRIPYANMGLQPKKDTILFTKDGTVGIAYKTEKDLDIITSGAVLHLTVKDKKGLLPDYLTLVLNSMIVQMQAERDTGGSVIVHWRPSDISNVVIPILDVPMQEKIAVAVQQSFEFRWQSEQLLDTAKQAVEMAIEQGEAAALKWLEVIDND